MTFDRTRRDYYVYFPYHVIYVIRGSADDAAWLPSPISVEDQLIQYQPLVFHSNDHNDTTDRGVPFNIPLDYSFMHYDRSGCK